MLTADARIDLLNAIASVSNGKQLSLASRIVLIRQAAHSALIIEEDYDSEFCHDGPQLVAMQGADAPVLYLGAFSKTMFRALRIAYIVVPKRLVSAFSALVAKSTLRRQAADQLCLAAFIGESAGLYLALCFDDLTLDDVSIIEAVLVKPRLRKRSLCQL